MMGKETHIVLNERKKKRSRQRGPIPTRKKERKASGRRISIIKTEPPKGQFENGIGLTALAFMFETTIPRIVGAIRAKKLRNDDTRYDLGSMRGPVGGKQQTFIHKSKIREIGKYLQDGT